MHPKRLPRPALLMLLAGLMGEATAARTPFQVKCEDTIDKTVTVLVARQSGYTINHTLSYRRLTGMQENVAGNYFVLGLTKTDSLMSLDMQSALLQDPASGYECVAPKISVSLYYSPVVIYIGREFPVGSCSYAEILAHEMRHLNTYFDHLPKVDAVVRAALLKRFSNKPLYAPIGQAEPLLQDEINNMWMPFIKNEMGKVGALQAAIDSPKEYARLSKVCKGEVQSLMGPGRRAR